jgi:hypothetical protein
VRVWQGPDKKHHAGDPFKRFWQWDNAVTSWYVPEASLDTPEICVICDRLHAPGGGQPALQENPPCATEVKS